MGKHGSLRLVHFIEKDLFLITCFLSVEKVTAVIEHVPEYRFVVEVVQPSTLAARGIRSHGELDICEQLTVVKVHTPGDRTLLAAWARIMSNGGQLPA